MNTYIALLRGINVVGRNRLPMKDLVRILGGLGFEDICTYIQSGNAVFRSPGTCTSLEADEISEAVEAEFGFRPAVMLLEKADLENAIRRNPFPTDVGKLLHFFFLETEPEAPDLKALKEIKVETEQFRLDGRVFYLYAPAGFAGSKVGERAERKLGVGATARNWNTVRKLWEMAEAQQEPSC